MTYPAQFDPAVIAAVRPGMNASLVELNVQMTRFLVAPETQQDALAAAHGELRRLLGVLKMIRLDGVAVFCAELDTVFTELAANPGVVSALHHDVLEHALAALNRYIEDLLQGADNATLRLFPQYQELQQLRGMDIAFELDLFFPNLNVPLPDKVLNIAQSGAGEAGLKAARTQYQQGLLRFLREGSAAAVQAMQQALDMALSATPPDVSRAFWWVSHGLLDCIQSNSLPAELNARKLLGRIDQQMRAAAAGDPADTQLLMNEMLYLIGHSENVSATVNAIRKTYALARYFPDTASLSPAELAQRLEIMREQLRSAQEHWELCVQGDQSGCQKFVVATQLLAQQSEKLDQSELHTATQQLVEFSQYATQPEQVRLLAIDMAMALLLLDSGINHYQHLEEDFQEQVLLLSGRMRATLAEQPVQPVGQLVQSYYQMNQEELLVLSSNEMLVNLRQAEQVLNDFFNDTNKRAELKGLPRLLGQIHGGLTVLSLQHAAELCMAIQAVTTLLDQTEQAAGSAQSTLLATALSALENYLQRLPHGHRNDVADLQSALAELEKLHAAPVQADVAQAQQPSVAVQSAPVEDQELLDVFLEEAGEVLETMQRDLAGCTAHPEILEPLITIRRGFHTLKGSGYMVGLNELAGVALVIERALNKWLQDGRPASPALLGFIEQAVKRFGDWVTALTNQGGVAVEAADLIATAEQIEQGLDPDIAAQIKLTEAAPAPANTGREMVRIGDISLPATLFKIASEEITQHATALQQQLAALRVAKPPVIQYNFMRAAHTLAGVNRTMGFAAVVNLASALETWLQARIEQTFTLSDEQTQLLMQAVAALDGMVRSICEQKMPTDSNDLVGELVADKDKLGTPEPPAVQPVAVAVQSAPAVATPAARMEKTGASPARPQVRDDVDEQLLPVFIEEADELCPGIGAGLRAWREQPADEQHALALKRLLHTLKGSSRMAGAMRIGELAHSMEDRVLSTAQQQEAGYWDALEGEFDRVNVLLEELRSGKTSEPEPESEEQQQQREPEPEPVKRRASDYAAPQHQEGRRAQDVVNMLRVRSDVVDRLVNEASEISVARSRMEAELRAFKDGLLELTDSVIRLRKQLREVEIQAESQIQARVSSFKDSAEQFDPLEFDRFTRLQELTRFMNESVHDVQTVQHTLLKNIDETSAAMSAQARLNRELQQGLMNVRMVPFNSISDRLYRIMRQTSKELGKRANLELLGVTVEMDRSVLEKMTAPFEHLLRNAIVHGLESEAARVQSGKNPTGDIRLSLRQDSNEVVFELTDDGGGLDFPVLRKIAISKGLLQENQNPSDEQLTQLIFASGVSTASEVTEVAGRGVGMDVVKSEIAALGGRIEVSSQRGLGTKFTIHLPLTLAVTQTLMVRSGDTIYAIPSVMVAQVRQVKTEELTALYEAHQVMWQEQAYPLFYLPHLLGDIDRISENLPRNSLLLVKSGQQRIALHVDEFLGNQEVVVKNIGPQLSRLPGVAGATVMGNGKVVLILNPAQFAQRISVASGEVKPASTELLHSSPLVMVVDDSLTVRKITTRLLVRAGYQVETAKDGVDALEQLSEISPAVMLLDVEMPRMDGFELTKRLRQDSKTRHIPIIMITSRTADKHRDYALQLGVNVYLGKPFQEEELLQQITQLIEAQQ